MQAMVLKKLKTPLNGRPCRIGNPGRGKSGQGEACGVCRTDLHVVDGNFQTRRRRSSLVTRSSPDRCDRNRRGRADDGERVGIPGSAIPAGSVLLPHAPGKSVRPSRLYRIHARWWLCHRDNRRCALRLPAGRSRQRRVSCAFALRRLIGCGHWQSLAMARSSASMASAPQLISSRKSRFGRGDPYLPSPDLETSPPKPSPGSSGPLGQVAPTSCRLSNSMRRSSSRPLGTSSLGAQGDLQRRARRLRGIHMSDIPSFPYALLWKSVSSCRSPISRDRTASISCARRRRWASSRTPRPIRSRTPTRPWPICAPALRRRRRACALSALPIRPLTCPKPRMRCEN